ncbi:MAG: sigma-70 family RNA polymerase sigma factor [Bacteroidota bacterium]|nr:sigma-70 family RNA polymerase sigma factor [Bacteroidota bacterium]
MVQNTELADWVKKYTKELLSWALHKTSDLQVAEDLVQDTFVVAVEKYDSFRHESQPKTWLYGILNNKIAEFHRSKSKFANVSLENDNILDEFFDEKSHWRPGTSPIHWNPEETHLLDNEEFLQVFQQCLEKLPEQWYSCLTLKYLEGKDATKVCQDLGVSPTNYWQMVHRAKLNVRQCIERKWFQKNEKK